MAKLTDPDGLVRSYDQNDIGVSTNIFISTATTEIALGAYSGLSDTSFVNGGVSLQAVYSYLKEEWKTDSELIKFPFPMVAITPEQFEFVDGWTPSGLTAYPKGDPTISLFRDAGFAISTGTTVAEFIGVISLGDVEDAQVYYAQSGGNYETGDFVLTGAVNQCVQVYGDVNNGDYDLRNYFKVYAREQARIYDDATHTDIGVTTFTYQAYRFPLANSDDLKVTQDDSSADNSGVTITYYSTGQPFDIDGADSYYDVVIDGNGIPKQNIYEAVQSALRKTTDIDNDGTGVVSGVTADLLLAFVGDTLVTKTGVYISNIASVDTNAIEFYDTGNTLHVYPYVSAGNIYFNDNLTSDSDGIFKMFFTECDGYANSGDDFGTINAIIVEDNSSAVITGVTSVSPVAFDYDYNNNQQRGNDSSGTTAPVTVVAIGYDTAQYVKTTGDITQSKVLTFSLVAALERNYSNPA